MRSLVIVGILVSISWCIGHAETMNQVEWYWGSVALTDDASAMRLNPAAMGIARSLNYALEARQNADEDWSYGGLLYAIKYFGFSYEHYNDLFAEDRDLRVFSLVSYNAFLAKRLGIGAAFRNYYPQGADDHNWDLDYGLIFRPNAHFSVGAVAKNIWQAKVWDFKLSRSYIIGVGFRPINHRLSFGVDAMYLDETDDADEGAWHYKAIVQAEIVNGVALELFMNDDEEYGAGVSLNFGLGGLSLGRRYAQNDEYAEQYYRISAGIERTKTIFEPKHKIAQVELEGAYSDQGKSGDRSILNTLKELAKIEQLGTIQGVLVSIRNFKTGLFGCLSADMEEIRNALQRLRNQGITVVAYLEEGAGISEMVVAGAATKVVMPKLAQIQHLGAFMELKRVRGLLDKAGVALEVQTAGQYKDSFQQFSAGATDAQKELIRGLVAEYYSLLTDTLATSRGIDDAKLQTIASGKMLNAEEAKSLGLIDEIGFEETARKVLLDAMGKKIEPDQVSFIDLDRRIARQQEWSKPKIAVISAEGAIMNGKSRETLLSGRIIGADTVCEQLAQAAKDPTVKGIVFRINSGGGSAIASEKIGLAIKKIRAQGKPVVTSMGKIAASGGYWIPIATDWIIADAATLTGSIGVISVRPVLKELYAKLGIKPEQYYLGDAMPGMSTSEPLPEDQLAETQEMILYLYDIFLENVAQARKLPRARVEELAQGKVYTGSQALTLGLIDEIGDFHRAVQKVQELADFSGDPQLVYYLPKRSLLSLLLSNQITTWLGLDVIASSGIRAQVADPLLEFAN